MICLDMSRLWSLQPLTTWSTVMFREVPQVYEPSDFKNMTFYFTVSKQAEQ